MLVPWSYAMLTSRLTKINLGTMWITTGLWKLHSNMLGGKLVRTSLESGSCPWTPDN